MWNRILNHVFTNYENPEDDKSDWPASRQVNIKAISYTLTILVVVLAVCVVVGIAIILGAM